MLCNRLFIVLLFLTDNAFSQQDGHTPFNVDCTKTFTLPETGKSCANRSSFTNEHKLLNTLAILEHSLDQLHETVSDIPVTHSVTPTAYPRDCQHAHSLNGQSLVEGIHMIQPEDYPEPFPVYCQVTDNDVWTVIQRRQDSTVSFANEWQAYKFGFGYINGNHWLGNEKIFYLLRAGRYKLRIDLGDWSNNKTYAEYEFMQIGNEASEYTLLVGQYFGTAGDSFSYHNAMRFSTKDNDNDRTSHCCACNSGTSSHGRGGWWYDNCHQANLNGMYYTSNNGKYNGGYYSGMEWYHWHGHYYSLKETTMKVQRVHPCWDD
ncbi:fibrinogen-like protein A [Saccoglossus kowalevskii]